MSERLQVLIVPEWYPAPDNPVAGVFVRDQAVAVAAAHEVTVLVHDMRPSARRRGSLARTREHGLATIRVRTRAPYGTTLGRAQFLVIASAALSQLRRAGRAPDVLHAHVFSAGLAALALARGRRPVVVSEHHSDFIEGKVQGRAARVARVVFRRAARVCPVSEYLRRHLEAFEPRGRYEVVPNVVEVEAFSAPRPRRQRRPGEPARLLVVALLAPQKGMSHLLEALAQLRDTRSDFVLDVVGDGPSRAQAEALAARLLPAGVVAFHGSRPRAEVAQFMARADLLVLPSIVETFGVVVVEALAAGLPVLTTDAVGACDVIDGRFGRVVAAADAGALRDGLEAMLDDPPPFSAQAAAAEARRYGAAAVSRRWDEIYRSVAGGR
ncbi:MAG: glycosyltransferase [Actinobacteria bacterium]|nr:glycosyltransferase [Actinomycetota bacterium]